MKCSDCGACWKATVKLPSSVSSHPPGHNMPSRHAIKQCPLKLERIWDHITSELKPQTPNDSDSNDIGQICTSAGLSFNTFCSKQNSTRSTLVTIYNCMWQVGVKQHHLILTGNTTDTLWPCASLVYNEWWYHWPRFKLKTSDDPAKCTNRMLFNDDIYWLLMFYRQDCTLLTLMLILCVCIVYLHFHCLLCVWQSFIKEFYYYYYHVYRQRTHVNSHEVTARPSPIHRFTASGSTPQPHTHTTCCSRCEIATLLKWCKFHFVRN